MIGATAPADRWAVVAGASGSLGRPLAEHLAASGWRVLALDRDAPAAPLANVVTRSVDVSEPAAVELALDSVIAGRDPIGLLVNALGLIWNEPVLSLRGASLRSHDLDSWRRVIEANLTAPFVLASGVARRMARTGGGAVVNFSSIAARGNAGQAAYSAAKAGIEGLTRAMANELGPMGIRVNAIAPGFIDVASTRKALTPDQLSAIGDRTPLRRLGQVSEILTAVDFLAANAFVTGVVLDLSGGCRL
jgi:3-oxoacyl-[acyl-carrier protein] reductase